jgi:hypothetical protein
VGWPQLIFGAVLVVALLGLSIVYFLRQRRALRELRQTPDLPPDERDFRRGQARRRLVSSTLMLLLAAMLLVLLVFFENPAQRLADERAGQPDATPLTAAQRLFVQSYGGLVIVLLLVLLALMVLAALDFWATRDYARREQRKLRDERRAMIQDELARLRQQRNGHA